MASNIGKPRRPYILEDYTLSLIEGAEAGDPDKTLTLIQLRLGSATTSNIKLSVAEQGGRLEDEDFLQAVALATLEAVHSSRKKDTGEPQVGLFKNAYGRHLKRLVKGTDDGYTVKPMAPSDALKLLISSSLGLTNQ